MNKNFFFAVLVTYLFAFANVSARGGSTGHFVADKFDRAVIENDTVSDYDGNVYNTVQIGNQLWIKENLKSLHYSDGTSIPDVVAYDNSDSLAGIYGRLYTWDAAMKNSTIANAQGVCPCEWHVPSDNDWKELEKFLGGTSVAGGKMKTTTGWKLPNTGATNSSGFSALAAGEYDSNEFNKFQLFNEYAVFWTSTNVSISKARERYLAYNKAASNTYDWYKTLKYSIRCVKDSLATSVENNTAIPGNFNLFQNYPNPFNPLSTIRFEIPRTSFVKISVINILGKEIKILVNEEKNPGQYEIIFDANELASGIYYYTIRTGEFTLSRKMILLR